MPKSLIGHAIQAYRENKCDKEIHSGIHTQGISFGRAFYDTLFLPKYAILTQKPERNCIPHSSVLYDKIKEVFVAEISNHPDAYPQGNDAQKYETELKFQLLATTVAMQFAIKPHEKYSFSKNHFNWGHQLGYMSVIGNGNIHIPILSNLEYFNDMTQKYGEVYTPNYSNADFSYLQRSFEDIRKSSRVDLEKRYNDFNRAVCDRLLNGEGATKSKKEIEKIMFKGSESDYKINELIDVTRINKLNLWDIALTANSIARAKAPKVGRNSVAPDVESRVSDKGMLGWIQRYAVPDHQELINMFPQCGAMIDKVHPFAEHSQEVYDISSSNGVVLTSIGSLVSQQQENDQQRF